MPHYAAPCTFLVVSREDLQLTFLLLAERFEDVLNGALALHPIGTDRGVHHRAILVVVFDMVCA